MFDLMDVDKLEQIRTSCKKMIKELNQMMVLADTIEDRRIVQRLHSAQSRLLFAKFVIHELLRAEYVDIIYDDDECSSNSICDECPC